MSRHNSTIHEVVRLGILYKREGNFLNNFTGEILESVRDLNYTTPAEGAENMRHDARMVLHDMNVSIEKCKSEFELAEI